MKRITLPKILNHQIGKSALFDPRSHDIIIIVCQNMYRYQLELILLKFYQESLAKIFKLTARVKLENIVTYCVIF